MLKQIAAVTAITCSLLAITSAAHALTAKIDITKKARENCLSKGGVWDSKANICLPCPAGLDGRGESCTTGA